MGTQISISKLNRNGNTDPRYCRGVFINRAGPRAQAAAEDRAASLECHPTNNGWEYDRCDSKGRVVYQRDGLEARYLADEDGWFIAPVGSRDGEIFRGFTFRRICRELEQEHVEAEIATEADEDIPFDGRPVSPPEYTEVDRYALAPGLDF